MDEGGLQRGRACLGIIQWLVRLDDEGAGAASDRVQMRVGEAASQGQPALVDSNRLCKGYQQRRSDAHTACAGCGDALTDTWPDVALTLAGGAGRWCVLAEAGGVPCAARAVGTTLVAVVLGRAAAVFVDRRLAVVEQGQQTRVRLVAAAIDHSVQRRQPCRRCAIGKIRGPTGHQGNGVRAVL